jgi:hypothetical protein
VQFNLAQRVIIRVCECSLNLDPLSEALWKPRSVFVQQLLDIILRMSGGKSEADSFAHVQQ